MAKSSGLTFFSKSTVKDKSSSNVLGRLANKHSSTDDLRPGYRRASFLDGFFGAAGLSAVRQRSLDKKAKKEETAKDIKPSLSAINAQLKEIAVIALRIGVITQKQQEAILKQIKETTQAEKEAQYEARNAVPAGGVSSLESTLPGLLAAIAGLTTAVDEATSEKQGMGGAFLDGFFGAAGLLAVRRMAQARARKPKLRRGFGWDEKSGRYYKKGKGSARGFVREEDALKNARKADLRTQAAQARRGAARSGQVANTMAQSVRRTGAGAVLATKESIARIARPIVKNAVTRTAIKSIPIVGAIAGLGFAASRLLDGDVVGAGLDAASGLAGPLTAIPALVASIVRDVYTEAFKTFPETDPLSRERLALITDIVSKQVKDWFGTITTDATPVAQERPTPAGANNRKPDTASPGPTVSPSVGMNSWSQDKLKQVYSGAGMRPPAPPTNPTANRETAPSVTATPPPPATPATAVNTSMASSQGPVSPEPVTQPTRDGNQISLATEAVENAVPASSTTQSTARTPAPAQTPTTTSGSTGMGNVPNPNYEGADAYMYEQLYFGAAA